VINLTLVYFVRFLRFTMSSCIFKNCPNTSYLCRKLGKDVQFFRLPKAALVRNSWIRSIRLDPGTVLKDCNRVCSDHFLESDYANLGGRRDLLPNAVPQPFLSKSNYARLGRITYNMAPVTII